MPENPGQEQRTFMAILLAMGVLLVWNVVFPPPVRRPPSRPERPAEEVGAQQPGPEEGEGARARREEGGEEERAPAGESGVATLGETAALLHVAAGAEVGEPRQVRAEGEELAVTIDARGARVVEAVLKAYPDAEGDPVQLLPEGGAGALGSVVVLGGREIPLDRFAFRLASDTRTREGRRVVWELALEEFALRKTYVIPEAGNVLRVEHELLRDDVGLEGWGLSWAGGMRVTEQRRGRGRGAYFQGCVHAEGKVQRKSVRSLRRGPREFPGQTFFVGVQNKYFLGAIVPEEDQRGPARLWRAAGNGAEGSVAGEILVERTPGLAADQVRYEVYVGPLDYAKLAALGHGLEGAVDMGAVWVQPISRFVLAYLIWLHRYIPNYGFVIIVFSLTMNIVFFPLTYKSTKSMRDMAALKPRLEALKEKYKDQPEKLSKATMELYKEAGVNPLGGCLPLLLQMPIFFALYRVLYRTIELRQAPFVLWIRDLSQPDVVFDLPFALPLIGTGVAILPIIMGATSFLQSRATMADPSQKTMSMMMPIVMTFIFFTMPSGLVLYWLMSNVFTIGQRYLLKPSAVVAGAGGAGAGAAGDGGGGRPAGGDAAAPEGGDEAAAGGEDSEGVVVAAARAPGAGGRRRRRRRRRGRGGARG